MLAALGVAALIGLQPWVADSVSPQLSVAPGLGVGLGESVAVAPGPPVAVAAAHPASGGKTTSFAASETAAGGSVPGSQQGIAPARAVTSPRPGSPPASSPKPPSSEPPPGPQPSPAPVVVPVAAPAPPPPPEPAAPLPTRVVTVSHPPGPSGAGIGAVEGSAEEGVEVHEGDERAFSFSFFIEPTVYLSPSSENLIVQFKGAASELPSFGLQLWDDGSGSQRGLWASGEAMGGERFLAPLAEGVWHEAVVYFRASSEGDGFYLLILDGQPIDARAGVSLIEPGSAEAQIEIGLFRDGERIVGTPDITFGPTSLGETLESVIP